VLDPAKNQSITAQEAEISTPGSRVRILVIPTNEELVVAREVKRHLEKSAKTSTVPAHAPAPGRSQLSNFRSMISHNSQSTIIN
jgi:hypothetical protein